jgi:hypothetical protein
MSKLKPCLGRVALLWRGDDAARHVTPETSRFSAIFRALADVGVDAKPVVYEDDVLDAVRAQLATLDGVLVWVNPIHEGRDRAHLDALLREVAARGVWVSAHPHVILKMGTKEVLHRTRTMSWGATRLSTKLRRRCAPNYQDGSPLPAGDQAQSRQRRSGCLEGQNAGKFTRSTDGASSGRHEGRGRGTDIG